MQLGAILLLSATVGLIQSQLPDLAPLEVGSSAPRGGVAALFAQLGYCVKKNKAKTLSLTDLNDTAGIFCDANDMTDGDIVAVTELMLLWDA